MYQFFIGIDISKKDFSVSLYPEKKTKIFTNDTTGFEDFCKEYHDYLPQSLTTLEITGGYELALIHHLQYFGYAVHRANGKKVKHFIKSLGRVAKTDAIDAAGLARYGFERHCSLELFKVNPQERLLKLTQRRLELKQMLVQEKNRRQAPGQQELLKSFNNIIEIIEFEISAIENEMEKFCKANPEMKAKRKVLEEIKGIGKIISMELIALLPEMGTINRKKIASLAGLAPHPNESGQKKGYRSTRGGRADIKPILFMAAMSAARSNCSLGQFYSRLVNAGKKKMVALVALMRKILVIANAKIRDFIISQNVAQHG